MVLTDWFTERVEPHIVYGTSMAGKLMQKLSCPRLPNGYALITATSSNFLALGVPACLEEVALLTGWGSVVCLDAPIRRRERSHVPSPNSRVVCVGEESLVVRRHLERGDGISVTQQRVCDGLFPQIPDLDVIIDASGEQLVTRFCQAYRGYGKVGGDECYGVFGSRVPDLSGVRNALS